MMTAAELRAEAQHLGAFALTVTDPNALAEISVMIQELELRSRELGNGGCRRRCRRSARRTAWLPSKPP